MKPFDIKKFAEQVKFGKGIIKDRKKAKSYIESGYNPEKLLLHFKVNSDTLQYILAQTAINKSKYN